MVKLLINVYFVCFTVVGCDFARVYHENSARENRLSRQERHLHHNVEGSQHHTHNQRHNSHRQHSGDGSSAHIRHHDHHQYGGASKSHNDHSQNRQHELKDQQNARGLNEHQNHVGHPERHHHNQQNHNHGSHHQDHLEDRRNQQENHHHSHTHGDIHYQDINGDQNRHLNGEEEQIDQHSKTSPHQSSNTYNEQLGNTTILTAEDNLMKNRINEEHLHIATTPSTISTPTTQETNSTNTTHHITLPHAQNVVVINAPIRSCSAGSSRDFLGRCRTLY